MSDFDANPFSDPFADQSVTSANNAQDQAALDDFNPFANSGSKNGTSEPAVMQATEAPPAYTPSPAAASTQDPRAATQQQVIAGHEELLKRQEELERKAEELQRREQQMNQAGYNPRANNWPPLPSWFPIGPCFYQDFTVDIPAEFQRTIKMLYYSWMFYIVILFINLLTSLAIFTQKGTYGTAFGLSVLWFLLFSPCSMCWYRPAYNAFKSDSSFYFFLFFFIFFFQSCWSVVQAVGIPGWGYSGWIVAFSVSSQIAISIMAYIQSVLFTLNAVANIILLKKVHSVYRSSGASFEKAQQEFATGVMKNPGVQRAAADAAGAAVTGSLNR